jgi:2-methylcitrate dehydratase PrpD
MAAYANGRLANLLDFDETYRMMGHHAHSAFAAVAAVDAVEHIGLDRATDAFVIGYEVGARVARYIGDPLTGQPETGQLLWAFPGSVLATYAACAAACAALGVDAGTVADAFGICAQYLPSDVNVWDEAGSAGRGMHTLKYEDNGWTSHTGLMAALVARSGVTATRAVFSESGGLASKVRPDARADTGALVADLGREWAILETSVKLWPSCRWFHYALTGVADIVEREALAFDDIEAVHVESVRNVLFFASPRIAPGNIVDAQFSLPHSIAMVAAGVPAGPAWFTAESIQGERFVAFRDRVTTALHPSADDRGAWRTATGELAVPTRVTVVARGRTFVNECSRAAGDPGIAASDAALRAKMAEALSDRMDGAAIADRVWQAFLGRAATVEEALSPLLLADGER